MRAKKSLGQNFLMHAATAERIVEASGVGHTDTVVEIGPGTGMMTGPLLSTAAKVIAIEADGELVAPLRERFSNEISSGRLELIHADIRALDAGTLPPAYHVVANIPYYLTGEIIRAFLSASNKPRSMTLLVQKEVAERVARDQKGSILSIAVRAYGTPRYRFTVPRGAFRPAPGVDSAVLSIENIHASFKNGADEARFFEVMKAGFAHKRKKLAKNLDSVATPVAIRDAFAAIGLENDARAEELSVANWQKLAAALPA